MNSTPHASRGLTLLELLVVVIIVAIMATLATISWLPIKETVEASTVQTNVRRAFTEARMTAVYNKSLTTICPLDNDKECTNNWNNDVVIFTDQSNQKKVSSEDQIQYVLHLADSGTILSSYSGYKRRRYFQFKPDGSVNGSIGNLIWCPESGNERKASQVRINFGGRLFWAKDQDNDDVVENSSGQPISCS